MAFQWLELHIINETLMSINYDGHVARMKRVINAYKILV
jgi:hypothetical protein